MKQNIFLLIFGVKSNSTYQNTHTYPPKCISKAKYSMTPLFYISLYFLSCLSPLSSSGQVIHQSFELEERKEITINLDMPYATETWAGNTILTETKVKMENISPHVLKHFIQEGRYEIVESLTEAAITLTMKEMDRRPLRSKNGDAKEIVNIKIYVPDDCTVQQLGKGSLVAQTGEGE